MKKPRKKQDDLMEMLDAESEYRRQQTGNECDEPFITTLLYLILSQLEFISLFLCVFGGILIALLFVRL